MGPLLGELSSAQLAQAAKAGGSAYEELGVHTLINGQGAPNCDAYKVAIQ